MDFSHGADKEKGIKGERKMNKIKNIMVAFIVLSIITSVVNAGNISPGASNTDKTNGKHSLVVTITSPIDGVTLMDNVINVGYTVSGDIDGDLKYQVDDEYKKDLPANKIVLSKLTEGAHTVSIVHDSGDCKEQKKNDDANNGCNILASVTFVVDRTAPDDVTNIATSSITANSITWSWTNPTDDDFNNTRVTVIKTSDGTVVPGYSDVVLPKTQTSIVVSGLSPSTDYTITIRTEDIAIMQ